MEKLRCLKIIFIIAFCVFLYALNFEVVSALEPKLVQCTMSNEYKDWLSLSEEEQNSVMRPAYCASDADKSEISVMGITSKIDSMFESSMSGTLPESYDLRETEYKPILKDQVDTGGCWAFATSTTLETIIKKKYSGDDVFSTRHIEYATVRGFKNGLVNEYGYNRDPGTGGDYQMAASYLANGLGPVSEKSMPFENNENVINLSEIDKEAVYDVNDVVLNIGTGGVPCTAVEISQIKEYIYEYGAVAASIYMVSSNKYYNRSTGAYYYNGRSVINHAITLIGWDDNYSKNNFGTVKPSSNGAWIVQNSYGSNEGKNGYNYISYEDVRICDQIMAVKDVDKDVNDNSYIHDKLGYNQFFGYELNNKTGLTTAYAMNVFTKDSNKIEVLKEITLGSAGTGKYKIYLMEGNGSKTPVSKMTLIGSGDLKHSGYVTHKLEKSILLKKGVTDFSIAVFYSMDTSVMPVPVSVKDNSRYSYVTAPTNGTFVSSDGNSWSDLSNFDGHVIVASIKAFTDDFNYEFNFGRAKVSSSNENYNVTIDFSYSSNVDSSKLLFELTDENGFTFNNHMLEQGRTSINLTIKKNGNSGFRKLIVYYDNNYVEEISFVLNDPLTSSSYRIDNKNGYIYVPPKVDKTLFKKNIKGLLQPNSLGSTGYMYTGMQVENYIIIVLGDPTGDGIVTPLDYIMVKNHIMGTDLINDPVYKISADYNEDLNINPLDYVGIKNYIMVGE